MLQFFHAEKKNDFTEVLKVGRFENNFVGHNKITMLESQT